MKYCQLRANDVLLRDGKPIFVVLECNPENNVFRWLSLLNKNIGKVGSADFEYTKMWDEDLFCSYDVVLRGNKEIVV